MTAKPSWRNIYTHLGNRIYNNCLTGGCTSDSQARKRKKILKNIKGKIKMVCTDIYAHPMAFYTLYAAMSCEQFLFFLILLLEPVNFQWRRKVESAFFCM